MDWFSIPLNTNDHYHVYVLLALVSIDNAFLVSGVIVATLLMLGVRHVQRLYNEKK
ncbi:hypothetical protein Goarm_009345, partial [Gossypium armourianum]|nr:hypothetical protein [Gossypium armourianum]